MSHAVPCAACRRDQMSDQAVICTACTSTLAADLRGVCALLEELHITATSLSRTDHPVIPHRREPDPCELIALAIAEKPLGYDWSAADAREQVRSVVRGWTVVLAIELNELGAPIPDTHIPDASIWLAENVAALRHRDWAGECATEMHRALMHGWRVVDQPAPRHVAALCTCGQMLWTHEPVDNPVTCRSCGLRWDDVTEQRLAMQAWSDEAHLTGPQCAQALSGMGQAALAGTIRQWVRRGRLVSVGGDAQGRALYRLGDVRVLAYGATRSAG